jgi:hypothetical protein
MKKLILLFALSSLTQIGFSQGVTMNPKVANGGAPNSSDKNISVVITNNTTDSTDNQFTWFILEVAKQNGWTIDFCDPANCIVNVGVGTQFDFSLNKGAVGIMKADFYYNGVSGSGSLTAVVRSKKNPSNADTATFNATAWVTSVNEASSAKNIALYPNPVKNQLGISYQSTNELHMDIYNVLGVKVKSFTYTNTSGLIDISDLQNGVYFVRFADGGKSFTKQFTKTN